MSTKYEYYDTGDNTYSSIGHGGTYWYGQTFTPVIAHTITSVKLKLWRTGSPGTLTVGIRATAAGVPVGGDLCSGTINGNSLTTDSAGLWYEITLGAGAWLTAGIMYAIVCRVSTGSNSDHVEWRYDTTGTYTVGTSVYSLDSGSNWGIWSAYDYMFEDWGDPLFSYSPASRSAAMAAKMIAGKLI